MFSIHPFLRKHLNLINALAGNTAEELPKQIPTGSRFK